MPGKLTITKDTQGEYRWSLRAPNGEPLAHGGEGFKEKRHCMESIESVKKNLADAIVDDQTSK